MKAKFILKLMIIFLTATIFVGCGDNVEKCDNDSVKGTVKEILLKNGIQIVIENQAKQSLDKELIASLIAKEIKKARFILLEEKLENMIEGKNDKINEENEKIKADNRYSETKKPLIPLIDGRVIIQDLEKYKTMIDSFEPINSSDNFTRFFQEKILSKRPFPIFVSFMAQICPWGAITCNQSDNQIVQTFEMHYFFGNDLRTIPDFRANKEDKIVKELSKKEVERISRTLDVVNIRELSVNSKTQTRQCEANMKLNDNIGTKIFKYNIRHQDDGSYLVQADFR